MATSERRGRRFGALLAAALIAPAALAVAAGGRWVGDALGLWGIVAAAMILFGIGELIARRGAGDARRTGEAR